MLRDGGSLVTQKWFCSHKWKRRAACTMFKTGKSTLAQ